MTEMPTGVWNYKRIPLRLLFPELGAIPLGIYYKLRIACCGYLIVEGEDRMRNCHQCRNNHGWVCPDCLGARWLSTYPDPPWMVRCLSCCYETVDAKGKIIGVYDEERERASVKRWLVHRFPYGVPGMPTEQDLVLMDRR